MTVKILKQGTLPDKKYVTQCRNCACSFSFNASDAKFVYDQRDGNYYEIACPTCTNCCTVVA